MPWQETEPVDQRARFIDDHRHGLYAMTELCARYGVSRPTGYKGLARYDEGGRPALQERSHAPHTCPHRISDAVAALLCAARTAHPTRGPAKLPDWLRPRHPGVDWPAVADQHTRYLLACRGLPSTKGAEARAVLERAFRAYGLRRARSAATTASRSPRRASTAFHS